MKKPLKKKLATPEGLGAWLDKKGVDTSGVSIKEPGSGGGSGLGSGLGRASVANQFSKVIGSDSPLMKQAETAGMQLGQARGLGNSSYAIGAAQDAMVRAALPIAQQDAATAQDRWATKKAQRFEKNQAAKDRRFERTEAAKGREHDFALQEDDQSFQMKFKEMDLDQADQAAVGQMISNFTQSRAQQAAAIMTNPNMNAAQRKQAVGWIDRDFAANVAFVEDLFDVDLDFKSGATKKRRKGQAGTGGQGGSNGGGGGSGSGSTGASGGGFQVGYPGGVNPAQDR